jgi:CheY-like chemotaxis protein
VLHNRQQRNLGRSLPSRSAGKRWGAPPESRTLRVLVVEDDAMIRSLAVEMLAQLGHYVAEAAHANEAFELLDQREFDVLMADLYCQMLQARNWPPGQLVSIPICASCSPPATRRFRKPPRGRSCAALFCCGNRMM